VATGQKRTTKYLITKQDKLPLLRDGYQTKLLPGRVILYVIDIFSPHTF